MKKTKVRVAIIGLGENGAAYADIYKRNEYAEIVAMVDTLPDRAEKMARKFSVETFALDYHEVVTKPEVDAVSIHTADRFHAAIANAALEAGKHVYIEKPMATTIADCRRVIELAEKSDVKVMVGHVLRFNPLYSGIKEMVAAGELGEVYYAEGDYICDLSWGGATVAAHTYEIGFVCSGTHPFDLLRWYLGEPEEVQAYGNRKMACPEMEKDDFVCALYRFHNGCIVKVASTFASSFSTANHGFRYNLCLYGSKATVLRDKIAYRGKPLVELPFKGIEGHPYEPEVIAFLSAILNDSQPPITARDGGNTAIGILAGMEAWRCGRAVRVPVWK